MVFSINMFHLCGKKSSYFGDHKNRRQLGTNLILVAETKLRFLGWFGLEI